MKITNGQSVPSFTVKDIKGREISNSSITGKKTLLSFQRNVGCPVCNFHVHEMLEKSDSLSKYGIDVVLVYQSSPELMKNYLGDQRYPFSFVPDQENTLYRLFSVERSMGKVMGGMFHGAMGKMMKGNKLFLKKLPQDGNMDMIGADFLIDEKGKIIVAHYGAFLGDHLPVNEV
ncbi:MAG: AhpC/TSA family protein, partial [Cytophagales bacterium]|nr:AhpC/TSA family protein [Cytophagales bacterium]